MTGWEILGAIGAVMVATSLIALLLIVIARPRRDDPGHTVYLINHDDQADPVFAYELDDAVRRYHAGGHG